MGYYAPLIIPVCVHKSDWVFHLSHIVAFRIITMAVDDEPKAVAVEALDPLVADAPNGVCVDCSMPDQYLDSVLLNHFDLRVCVSCKQTRRLEGDGRYDLISKSKAKREYALPESVFQSHTLRFMNRPNPHHEKFAPVKLYLKQTMEKEAAHLHRDESGLEKVKRARSAQAYTNAAKRTKHLLKRKRIEALGTEELLVEGETPATAAAMYVPVADRDHRHAFQEERYDEDKQSWTKRCACGMTVAFEKW